MTDKLISDIVDLHIFNSPGFFEYLNYTVDEDQEFLPNIEKFFSKMKDKSNDDIIKELSKIFTINILSTNIGEKVQLFNDINSDLFNDEDFLDKSDFMFGSLGTDTVIEELYDYREIYSNVLQYNAFNFFDNYVLGGKNSQFRVYPASVTQMREFFLSDDSLAKDLTFLDYVDILDSQSVIFVVEYWGGQIGDKYNDNLGYIYHSTRKAIDEEKGIYFSDNLINILNDIKIDSVERNNRIKKEDTLNIKKIMN